MSQSLKIGIFVGCFPMVSETFVLRQITGLLEAGNEVRIFADTRPDVSEPIHPEVERWQLAGRTTYIDGPPESLAWDLPIGPLLGRTWPPGRATPIPNWRRLLNATPTLVRCALRMPRLTRLALDSRQYRYQAASLSVLYRLATLSKCPGGFDVLHAHFGPTGNSYRFARDLFHAPLVVSFHGYDFSTRPRKEGVSMYDHLFHAADLVTVNSQFTRTAVSKLGCPPEKLRLLPVGLDPAQFGFRERTLRPGEPVRLLTIARLTKIKGHEFALKAVAQLRSGVPRVHYDIVGDGPLRKSLEDLALQLGLKEVVQFHGALGGDEIASRFAEAHLFLLTSVNVEGDQEGQGLVLQEAQACGLPVVATTHGALPEGLVEGQSGFLVPEGDVESLASRLRWLIENSSKWGALGRAGRAFVENRYDIRKLNQQLLSIYSEARQMYGQTK